MAICMERKKALLVEGKCGRIDEHDASKAVRQLSNCFEYYRDKLIGFDFIPIFLREKRKRLEGYAREKLVKKGINIEESGKDLSLIIY